MSDTVRQRPEHTALIFKGTRMSYAQLEQLTNAFGAALVAQGGQEGRPCGAAAAELAAEHHRPVGRLEGGRDRRPHQLALHARELEHALNEVGAETVVVLTPFYDKVKSLQARTSSAA